jgi:hypothetical protein
LKIAMRRRLASPLAVMTVMAALAPHGWAEDAAPSGDAARIANRRLKLGMYGRPTAPQTALPAPRFESSVDVVAPSPPTPNETMAVYWRQWNLSTGSIYGKGKNFQNQGCPTCVNILPLIEKAVQKIKGK